MSPRLVRRRERGERPDDDGHASDGGAIRTLEEQEVTVGCPAQIRDDGILLGNDRIRPGEAEANEIHLCVLGLERLHRSPHALLAVIDRLPTGFRVPPDRRGQRLAVQTIETRHQPFDLMPRDLEVPEIGRASCRERV